MAKAKIFDLTAANFKPDPDDDNIIALHVYWPKEDVVVSAGMRVILIPADFPKDTPTLSFEDCEREPQEVPHA